MVILDANMYDQHHIDKKCIHIKNPGVKISEVWCQWLDFLSMNLDPSVPEWSVLDILVFFALDTFIPTSIDGEMYLARNSI